ncbi:DUF4329 domain-containing protein [Spirochaeta cellobiosiphila]|uniref:DUF4329 domain-containing protein n=1 Tax=Spirochaeta cellobiosiphila TaxID=504483 RepID=UPI00048B28A6|nr:DUF4329 domain-containing protein [Spirochaeta cellobiosiphila]
MNKELGSSIYKNEDGAYSYTVPNQGVKNSVNPSVPENGEEVVANIHAHVNATNPKSDSLSEGDVAQAEKDGLDIYVTTPQGMLQKWDVDLDDFDIISNDLAYDSKNINEKGYENNPDAYTGEDNEKVGKIKSFFESIGRSRYNSGDDKETSSAQHSLREDNSDEN